MVSYTFTPSIRWKPYEHTSTNTNTAPLLVPNDNFQINLTEALTDSASLQSSAASMRSLLLFLPSPPPTFSPLSSLKTLTLQQNPNPNPKPLLSPLTPSNSLRHRRLQHLIPMADDADMDAGGGDDYEMDEEEEVEEVDNKKDFDIEYDRLLGPHPMATAGSSPDDIEMVISESFVSTQGSDEETVVDYRINEDEFHKISLMHCDFFIRKPPDPDNNVYDFREVS